MGRCSGTPPLIVIACGNALKRNLENPSVIAAISMMKKCNHQPRALQRLYDKNKKILQLCKELLSNVPINDLENALKVLDRISDYDLVFDNSAISILTEKAVVTQNANIVFYYIDGSKFTYRISANTPKGQRNMNIRKEHHKQMLELYSNGMTMTRYTD